MFITPLPGVRTFLYGWKRTMYTLGTKRQPRATEALMLTQTHRVAVWIWKFKKTNKKKFRIRIRINFLLEK